MVQRPSRLVAGVLAGAAALILSPVLNPGSGAAVALADTLATSAEHPYGDPSWLPLREPAAVGCAKSACDTGSGHGYWSVDFIGREGDPVYAAGAGIAHVGGNSGSCVAAGSDVTDGRWVWIDHGAGVVTRYHHLNAIAVTEGQRVTPATRIGGMGHSGDVTPCATNYLHFEVRHGGVKGTRVDPGPLGYCQRESQQSLPGALGYSSWDSAGLHRSPRYLTPAADDSCVDPVWLTSAEPPQVEVTRGDRAATAGWPAPPSGADRVTVLLETWHPSIAAWGHPTYRTVPAGTTTTTFTGLENGRTYRVRASVHSRAGNSAWSKIRQVVPAGVPGAPRTPRYLTWPKPDYVHFGWYRPAANGGTVNAFTAARRCSTTSTSSYGAWRAVPQRVEDAYVNFRGLSAHRRCQVRVRATSDIGTGPWSTVRTVTR